MESSVNFISNIVVMLFITTILVKYIYPNLDYKVILIWRLLLFEIPNSLNHIGLLSL